MTRLRKHDLGILCAVRKCLILLTIRSCVPTLANRVPSEDDVEGGRVSVSLSDYSESFNSCNSTAAPVTSDFRPRILHHEHHY